MERGLVAHDNDDDDDDEEATMRSAWYVLGSVIYSVWLVYCIFVCVRENNQRMSMSMRMRMRKR